MAQINDFNITPRAILISRVLEAAKDAGDAIAIAACQRLIEADRRGWKKHRAPADWQLVKELGEELAA
jgi:hypothetical protein